MPKKIPQKPSQNLAAADASQDLALAKKIQVGSSPAAAAAPATAAAKVAPAESLEEQQAKKLCQEFVTFAIKAQLPTQEASSPVANLVKKYNDLCSQMPRSSTKSSKYHPDCKTSIGQMFNLLNINLVKLQKKSPSNLLTLDDVMSLADNLFGAFEFVRNHNLKAITFPENGANKLIFDSLQACLGEISQIKVQDDLLHNLLQFLDKFGFDKIPKPLQNKAVEALNFGAASVLSEGKTLKNIDYYLLNLTSHLMSFVAKDEDDFRACKEALEQSFSLCSEVFSICELDYEKTA